MDNYMRSHGKSSSICLAIEGPTHWSFSIAQFICVLFLSSLSLHLHYHYTHKRTHSHTHAPFFQNWSLFYFFKVGPLKRAFILLEHDFTLHSPFRVWCICYSQNQETISFVSQERAVDSSSSDPIFSCIRSRDILYSSKDSWEP